jgi:hypothetical protein
MYMSIKLKKKIFDKQELYIINKTILIIIIIFLFIN